MVNGQVNPSLNIRPGQVQRWRIVNASTARFYRLSLEGHSMYLIGTEGGLVDRPYQLSELIVSPGERVDLLIKANTKTGAYKFLSLPYDRGMNQLQQVTLLTLSCSGSRVSDAIPATINSNAAKLNMDTSMLPKKSITLSMGQGRGYINGITFTSHEDCYTEMSTVGGYELWEIINESGMDHPFHQHVNPAQVLSIAGGDSKYAALYSTIPAWKDVVIVPKWGRVQLLMSVMDFTGMTMFHCHIIEHEDIGMMAMWHLMGDPMSM
jgi:FtsP/CotA-like multicopper oxidase with cupredoxin domain